MSAPKHTAGPWRLEGRSFYPKGRVGFIVSHGVCPEGDGPAGYVCRVEPMFSDGPSEADARLIASAPDLLEALTEALDSERRRRDAGETYVVSIIAQMEAAIAKATGESAS